VIKTIEEAPRIENTTPIQVQQSDIKGLNPPGVKPWINSPTVMDLIWNEESKPGEGGFRKRLLSLIRS